VSTSIVNKTAGGVPCLICDAVNSPKAMACQECTAPMQFVHDLMAQEREPRIVTVMGDSNVGKTIYLGFLLDMLSQRANDYEAVPKGAYSVDLQHTVISHMAYRMFPPKTPVESNEWRWSYYQVRRAEGTSPWVDLIMPDMAGEAIAAEVASPSTFRIVRNLLQKSAGALLLIDAAMASNGSPQPDFFGLKMLSYLESMLAPKRDAQIDTPVAVVLCKADYCPECFDQPRRFVEANLNRMSNMARSRFARVEYFASSVVGSLAYATSEEDGFVRPIPLHVSLRGVLEPFEWVISQL